MVCIKGFGLDGRPLIDEIFLIGEKVKTSIIVYANKPSENYDRIPISSIRCQNATTRNKNMKRDFKEKALEDEDKAILLEAGYISLSNIIQLAGEEV